MELLHLLLISASCILVGVVGSHAAAPLPSEIYWKNKLPNTHMPTMLRDLLHPADLEGKASIDRAESRNIFEQEKSQEYSKKLPLQKLNLSQPLQQFALSKYGINTIRTDNAETTRQLINSPAASLFFLEKDLYPGAKMNLHFVVGTPSGTTFLPQKLAKMTPFSSNKLLEIFNQFAINPKSEEAELVNEIIMDCEQPAIENEEKYCATSLESLVEYGTSKLGKDVNVLTTVIFGDKGKRTRRRKQEYVVSSGVRNIISDDLVACHSMPYLYAVFYCHATAAHTTGTYMVPLVGADGMKIKATAVCHKDTSKWNPDHIAFQIFKVKPGTVPVCHFLTEDSIAWVAKNKDN